MRFFILSLFFVVSNAFSSEYNNGIPKIIGFAGSKGSFGHITSMQFQKKFPNNKIESFLSFTETMDRLVSKNIEYAVIPVKNKIIGEVKDGVAAIDKYRDKIIIVDTIKLPIVFCLCSKNATKIEDVTDVYSQDNALNQCQNFFKQHVHLKKVKDLDTAIACERVAKSNDKIAGICSEMACKLNKLNVLAVNFQDDKDNYTVFQVLKLKSV